LFNGPFSATTWVSQYQKGKTNLDFIEARDGEWQLYPHHSVFTGRMPFLPPNQQHKSIDNHASTPPLSFYMPDALPATQPTASKHIRQIETYKHTYQKCQEDKIAQS